MDDKFDYKIVPGKKDYYPFVYNSFLKSYRHTFPVKFIPDKIYYAKYHDILEYFLETRDLFVAVNQEDDDQLFGWVLGSEDELIYTYVKQIARGQGIGTTLVKHLDQEPHVFTYFQTEGGAKWLKLPVGDVTGTCFVQDFPYIKDK